MIDTFENIDRITQSRPKKIFPTKEPSRQSIMDQLLKETFDLNDTKVPVLGFKNEKYEGFDEDEDVLENVIKSFDKKENFVKYNEELDPEDLMREFEANEEVLYNIFANYIM